MMTEIYTIEGGQKRSLLTRGDQIYKKTLINVDLFDSSSTQKNNVMGLYSRNMHKIHDATTIYLL